MALPSCGGQASGSWLLVSEASPVTITAQGRPRRILASAQVLPLGFDALCLTVKFLLGVHPSYRLLLELAMVLLRPRRRPEAYSIQDYDLDLIAFLILSVRSFV